MHAERLNFRSIGLNPGESLLDYESRLNSFSKFCEFQNYDRDSAHLEMVLIAAPQKIKEKLLLTPDLTLDIAKNILKTMEVGSKWVSQASSIKLENNNDVKIKQEVNLNLAERDKQKGSNTSETGGSRKRLHAAGAVQINMPAMIKLIPHWEKMQQMHINWALCSMLQNKSYSY